MSKVLKNEKFELSGEPELLCDETPIELGFAEGSSRIEMVPDKQICKKTKKSKRTIKD